jgi:eukaryotic-like serine/threonine-protein kinase
MSATDFDPTNPVLVAGERLGVWRLQRHETDVPSGAWWRATHGLSAQTAWILVYSRSSDAGAVLLRMAQGEGQPWTHPDVAWPMDSGLTADGRPYVVMPAMEGEPLLQALQSTSLRRRLDWALQLCELLLLARAKGLALLELDPSLLWVGAQQQLRLHALALVRIDAQSLRLGSLEGQISQAAKPFSCPVALQGVPGGPQAQVHAVGMLMCLLVNGRLLHEEAPAVANTVEALTQWVSLSSAARVALDALLHRAVSHDPAQRPADLDELGLAIEAWLEQTGAAAATDAGVLAPPVLAQAAPAPSPALAQKPVQPSAAPKTVPVAGVLGRPRKAAAPTVASPVGDSLSPQTDEGSASHALRWVVGVLLAAAVLAATWIAMRGP